MHVAAACAAQQWMLGAQPSGSITRRQLLRHLYSRDLYLLSVSLTCVCARARVLLNMGTAARQGMAEGSGLEEGCHGGCAARGGCRLIVSTWSYERR